MSIQVERAAKQKVWKVWNEDENRERERETRAFRARKTVTPRFTDFFTDFEKFCSLSQGMKPQVGHADSRKTQFNARRESRKVD